MLIHCVSDIHLEWAGWEPPLVDADILILAGDIGNVISGVEAAKVWAQRYRYGCVFVNGNHDFWMDNWETHIEHTRNAALGSAVHVLENDVLVIGNVRILGATLWTDFKLYSEGKEGQARLVARRNMWDYTKIRKDPKLNPLDTQATHNVSVRWLVEQLNTPWPGKTVVVTHHAPAAESIDPYHRERNDWLSPAFASNLEYLMGPWLDIWFSGHTHYNVAYEINGTRVISNARGYADDAEGFDGGLVIEV